MNRNVLSAVLLLCLLAACVAPGDRRESSRNPRLDDLDCATSPELRFRRHRMLFGDPLAGPPFSHGGRLGHHGRPHGHGAWPAAGHYPFDPRATPEYRRCMQLRGYRVRPRGSLFMDSLIDPLFPLTR